MPERPHCGFYSPNNWDFLFDNAQQTGSHYSNDMDLCPDSVMRFGCPTDGSQVSMYVPLVLLVARMCLPGFYW